MVESLSKSRWNRRRFTHFLDGILEHENTPQSDNAPLNVPGQKENSSVGGGPGISSSCARLFAKNGMRVAIAARNADKPVLPNLEKTLGVRRSACDASEAAAVELPFQNVVRDLVINVPIDAAIGWTQEDGTLAHRLAGTSVDENMVDGFYPRHAAQ
jgi:hypothetical protein